MESSIYTSNEAFDINFPNDISNDVIVIDTSVNRIGVNIMEPHYSIDVRDFSDVSGIIYTDYLKTGAIISDLTPDTDVCYNLGSQDKKWNEIHANYLEVSGIKIKDASQFVLGSGTGGDAIVFPSDISVNGDISCVNLNVDGITIKDASKFSIGGGSGDTNGIEFMANTTITGDLTITGNINSSYITSLINSGSGDVNITVQNNAAINNQDIYSKYRGTNVLTDFSNQLVGYNPDIRTFTVLTGEIRYNYPPSINGSSGTQTYESYSPDHTIDVNIESTSWYRQIVVNGAYQYNVYIEYDFLIPTIVSGLKIITKKNMLWRFKLEISDDGTNFNRIQTINTDNWINVNISENDDNIIYTHTFDLSNHLDNSSNYIVARYFKLANISTFKNNDIQIFDVQFNIFDTSGTNNNKYSINNEVQPDISLNIDTPYTFDLTSVSASHHFNIYTQPGNNSANLYSGAVIDGSFLYLTIDSGTTTLYYDCSNHISMGGTINVINQSNYQNINVKFITDTNSIVRTDLTAYNKLDIASSSFNIVSTSGHTNNVDLCGVAIPLSEYYNVNSTLDLTVTNNSVYDISIDFVLLRNNIVIDNSPQTITVNAGLTNNNIISNSLSRLTFGIDDTVNVAFLTYIQDLDGNDYSINNASISSYQPIDISLNFNTINLSVEKFKAPPPTNNFNITVQNNTTINNQDIYSKYRGTNVLTDFSNQLVGFNPNVGTFTVLAGEMRYAKDETWIQHSNAIYSSSSQTAYRPTFTMDSNRDGTFWKGGSTEPHFLMYDLQDTKLVFGLKIRAPIRSFREFMLQSSNDGTNFTNIEYFSGFTPNIDNNVHYNQDIQENVFELANSVTGRYFKLYNIRSFNTAPAGFGNDFNVVQINNVEFQILDTTSTINKYFINNELHPDLSLNIDTLYTFDLTGVSTSHPFNIYTQDNNDYANLYSGAIIDGSFLYLTIDSATTTLYYDCSNHPGMGGMIDVINQSNYKNINVKFISDTNSIVRTDLTEYNKLDIASNSFNRSSTSGYTNSVDLCGVVIPIYGQYYDVNSLLDLTVTNNSVYDISIDFVLLHNNAVIDNSPQTITVNAQTTNTNINISNSLSRLTFGIDDTVNVAFLTYIQDLDNLNRSVNVPITGEIRYQQNEIWVIDESAGDGYKAMDNDLTTAWYVNPADQNTGESITFDLQNTKTVFGLKVIASSGRLERFTLKSSIDSSINFTDIQEFTTSQGYDDGRIKLIHVCDLSNKVDGRYFKLDSILTYGQPIGITEIQFKFLDTTNDQHLTNPELQPDISLTINSFNLEVSAPDYEDFQVGNLLTANDIEVDNIDIQNTLTIASETPTTAGDNLVFDGNQLTWKNAILDVREYIKNTDITQRGSAIIGKNDQGYKYFGGSVDISEDGNRIVIGTIPQYGNTYFGQVNVYEFSTNDNDWVQLGQTILFEPDVPYPIGGGNDAGQMGASVRINPAGNIIMFGTTQQDFDYNTNSKGAGYAEIYDLSYINNTDASWISRYKITPSQNLNDMWGHSVAMNYDATIVVISSQQITINNNSYTGQVKIYELSGNLANDYEYVNTKTLTGNANDKFGASVALDNAGNVLVIGAPAYNRDSFGAAGAAYIYNRPIGANLYSVWNEQRHEEGRENDRLGNTVAISGNGEVIAIGQGGWPASLNWGGLRILEWDGTAWLRDYDTTTGANNRNTSYDTSVIWSYFSPNQADGLQQENSQFGELGISLSYNGDKLAVGSRYWDYDGGTSNGAVQIFNWTGTNYEFVKILYGPDSSEFGSGLAISDNGKYMVVGAPKGESNKGLVYNYDLKSESINSGELYYNTSDYVLRLMP